MPVYEYECKDGHRSERVVQMRLMTQDEPKMTHRCECGKVAKLVPSRTGTPILKAGCGGFFKPNAR